ncbi:hypothetical protein M0802_003318 [Mischocyttarus mexicanus]|nr:hypothetical protein M0802_003318 [Mischocyttarus mexicanus]
MVLTVGQSAKWKYGVSMENVFEDLKLEYEFKCRYKEEGFGAVLAVGDDRSENNNGETMCLLSISPISKPAVRVPTSSFYSSFATVQGGGTVGGSCMPGAFRRSASVGGGRIGGDEDVEGRRQGGCNMTLLIAPQCHRHAGTGTRAGGLSPVADQSALVRSVDYDGNFIKWILIDAVLRLTI